MTLFRQEIPPHVAEAIRHLPPDVKRGVKAALRSISVDPGSGIPLVKDLEGFWKYRVRRYRVVYSIDRSRRAIRIIAVGHRRRIYEDVLEQLGSRKRA